MRSPVTLAICLTVAFGAMAPSQAAEVSLEQVISREHPSFRPSTARLTIGRDGKVYLASPGHQGGYILRLDRDGGNRYGGEAVYALGNATANASGVVASANGHFAHEVTLYDAALKQTGAVDDFLNNDALGWSGPPHVEAGASGEFYGLDHNRNRIVRLSATGKLLKTYAYPADRKQPGMFPWTFRVCEKTESFYLLGYGAGPIRCIGFDGRERWSLAAGIGWGDQANVGGFDVDDAGTLYVIGPRETAVRRYSADGKPAGTIPLEHVPPEPKEAEEATISELRVFGSELVLRHRHATELFQTYDRASGRRRHVVSATHERLKVTLPRRTWSGGEKLPLDIKLTGAPAPAWHVWLRSLDEIDYRELTWRDGMLQVPADLCGIYLLKVTPEIQPWQRGDAPEYQVRTWVEVKGPGSTGTVSVWTTSRRSRFAQGEAIPLNVQLRSSDTQPRAKVKLRLMEPGTEPRVVAEGNIDVAVNGAPAALTIPGSLTRALRPGSYTLTAEARGAAAAPQPLVIGPGGTTPFHYMQYGDYTTLYPQAGVWDLPDAVAGHVDRTRRLGVNLFVDRLGIPMHFGAIDRQYVRGELDELLKHLKEHPGSAAAEKYLPPFQLAPTLSAYSAEGIEQLGILMYNDAGLPLGTGFDNRKEPQLVEHIRKVTEPLAPFPALRGWSWASNWWVFNDRGSAAARTPEEKAAYEKALQEAHQAGRWSPVLDTVATRRLSYAASAQEVFNRTVQPIAQKHGRRLVTASAAPYRNVESYPPLSLANVDEIDLQAQWEQVAVPYHVPHSVDFYHRPGKRAWLHPEIWNDSGTGEQVLPTLFQGIMRGTDGVGCSGPLPPWGRLPADPRSGYAGTVSVFRTLGDVLRAYGPWLTTLENNDRVAIVVSGRMLKIDDWPNVYGTHFGRLLEAYTSCLHARHPATFVFVDDLKPDTLRRFQAILVVGQTVEFEPSLGDALKAAQQAGATILHDQTCRRELVRDFHPLGVAFNHFEKDPHPASDDSAYRRFPGYLKETVPTVAKVLDAAAVPVARCDQPELLMSERRAGGGRYLFVVNNTTPDLEPGHIWRTTLLVASRVPVNAAVKLNSPAPAVYDVFAGRRVELQDGAVTAELRELPARVYAVLPVPLQLVALGVAGDLQAGSPLGWRVEVRGSDGKPIQASVPLRLRLLSGSGELLHEEFTACGASGVTGQLAIPLNCRGATATLEDTELFSGLTARESLTLKPAQGVASLTTERADAAKPPARIAVRQPVASERGRSWQPAEERFGAHVRDLAVTGDGRQVVLSAFNWDTNLFGLDAGAGAVTYRTRIGQYFSFDPRPLPHGAAVQGFDFTAAEGYHLYLIGSDGQPERRFALYGLPQRLPHRFVPGMLQDHVNNFAVASDGSWVAAAGDLGLAVWAREGRLLWSQDWWKSRRHTALLTALNRESLLVIDGLTVVAHAATDGKVLWEQTLASAGEVRQVCASADGRTLALAATTDGGRVFILQGGKPLANIPTAVDDMTLSADGSRLAVVVGNQLKLYDIGAGLRWILPGDDVLHTPRFAPDGQRICCGSELGTVYVVDLGGRVLLQRDLGSLPAPAWTPEGDLILATWMGTVQRLGRDFATKWTTRLRPSPLDLRGEALAKDRTPTTRIVGWGNADPEGMPAPPNLLNAKNVLLEFKAAQPHFAFSRPPDALVDGKLDPPVEPWLPWSTISWFAEGVSSNAIQLDTFHKRLRVRAITFWEDPAHPESWLRDAQLEAWDVAGERWLPVMPLLSNQAVHTHQLPKPVEASRWRIVCHRHLVGNLRLAELALHGEEIGPSHPDVIAKRPVAVLFDEGDELKAAGMVGSFGLSFAFTDAYSRGRCLRLEADQSLASPWRPPFGHVLPTWDFEIAEKPRSGQYRYLEFSARALSPATKGWTLRLDGEGYGNAISCHAGTYQKEDDAKGHKVADLPGTEWRVYRVDLWKVFGKPVHIRGLRLAARGGPAAFDRVLLKRDDKDVAPSGSR